jgi:mannan endo-1,4-beta-mannosidase
VRERAAAVAAAVLAAGIAACAVAAVHGQRAVPVPRARSSTAPATARLPARAAGIITRNLAEFDAACSCSPGLTARYIRWGESEASANLAYDIDLGAVPLVELEPYGVSLTSVTDGAQDAYLSAFAKQVVRLGSEVIMSFAPEADNDTYPWGYEDVPAAVYVAAWRHVVSVFRENGAANVRWAWIMTADGHTAPLPPLFPGAAYVNYMGIDGYVTDPKTTFSGLFGATIRQMRQLADVPVMITETAADPEAGQRRWLSQVVAGVRVYGLAGFMWFDINQMNGKDPYAPPGNQHDWSIDGDPGWLAAFRATVRKPRG